MKKVVLCVPNLGIGGAEKFVVDIAERLDRHKYTVIVAQTRCNIESAFKHELQNTKISVVDLSGRSFPQMVMNQIKFLLKEKPDIVHANIGSLLHIMLACKLCGIRRRVYTVHNEAKLLYGNSTIKKVMYKLAFTTFGFVPVAICPTVKESLVDSFGLDPDKIPEVRNGVDIKRFSPAKSRVENDVFQIVSVGTLYWIKNQEMIIKTIVKLKNRGINLKLILLGDGENRNALTTMIRDSQAEEYIEMPGVVKNVENYLQNADLYVSASKTEGLPLSILEAMATGLPVVATNAGGTKDIVSDNVNGFIVRVDDDDAFETAILSLYCEKEKREEFAKESRVIAEKWSIDACVDGYSKLYEG